jgi:hypothetical protein
MKQRSRCPGLRIWILIQFLIILVNPLHAFNEPETVKVTLLRADLAPMTSETLRSWRFNVPSLDGTIKMTASMIKGPADLPLSDLRVRVNGEEVITSSNIRPGADTLVAVLTNLTVGWRNTLEVLSAPGPAKITVEGEYLLDVAISDPLSGSSIDSNHVAVTGRYVSYTQDVGVSVNGVAAGLYDGLFVAEDVPLRAGSNKLRVVGRTFDGVQDTDFVVVAGGRRDPPLDLDSNISSGIAPLEVAFYSRARGRSDGKYSYDFNGDGIVDSVMQSDDHVSFTYTKEGIFRTGVTFIKDGGTQLADERIIVVEDRERLNKVLSDRWRGFAEALKAQDIGGSQKYFLPHSRNKYGAIHEALKSKLPRMYSEFPQPQLIKIREGQAQYRITRKEEWEGEMKNITYYIWFNRDTDGLWKIYQF